MDSKCLETERVMEGVRNLVEKNRCPLFRPLGLVFRWGNPYSFFFPQMRFSLFLLSLKNSPQHPTLPHPSSSGLRVKARKWGRRGERGLGRLPLASVLEAAMQQRSLGQLGHGPSPPEPRLIWLAQHRKGRRAVLLGTPGSPCTLTDGCPQWAARVTGILIPAE